MRLAAEELKKLLIKRGMLLFIVLMLALKLGLALTTAPPPLFQTQQLQNQYQEQIAALMGPLTAEKRQQLLSAKSRLDDSDSRIEEAFEEFAAAKINSQQLDEVTAAETDVQIARPLSEHLYQQYEYVAADPTNRYFVDPVGWSAILASEQPDYLLVLAVIVLSVLVFSGEDKSGMAALNLTATKGRMRLAALKLGITGLVCLLLVGGCLLIDVVQAARAGSLFGFGFPIQSIPFFALSTASISLGSLLFQMFWLRLLGACLLSALVLLVYLCSRSTIAALCSGLAYALVPLFVCGSSGALFWLPLPAAYLVGSGFYRGTDGVLMDDGSTVYVFQAVPGARSAALVPIGILLIVLMLAVCVWRFLAAQKRGAHDGVD
ncbi:MAG: hypothetical protein FWF71_06975 [Actinomycetia bacterium]|nr:hypothetical protein [Actinomycetes bacterium]